MKLLILGASGGCGRWVTRLAADEGHDVVTLVRSETAFDPPSGVKVLRGSALETADVLRALDGREAVISCVGARRINPRNPFSPLQAPGPVAAHAARVAVQALKTAGVRRCVVISAAGVGDSVTAVNPIMRWLLRHSTIGKMYADLHEMEQVLAASDLDWYAVRPVTLIDAAPSTRAHQVRRFGTFSIIGRGDVAARLLSTAVDPSPIQHRTPMVGWW